MLLGLNNGIYVFIYGIVEGLLMVFTMIEYLMEF